MWKLIVAFIVFAALALYMISKGGDSVDMTGEKHGADVHAPAADSGASTPAAPAAPAASEAAPAAASAASA